MTTPAPVGLIGWVDPQDLQAMWATQLDPDDLAEHLAAAHAQCVMFLGTDPAPTPRLRLAQTLQARALVRSGYAAADDSIGMDSVTVFPMDWTVKNLLRPKKAKKGPR